MKKFSRIILFILLPIIGLAITVEPVSSKRALFVIPFQTDFKKDYLDLLVSLHKNYELDIISDVDITFNVDGDTIIYEKTKFDILVLDDYINKMSDYDLVYFDSHGSSSSMVTGVPAPRCTTNEELSTDVCKKRKDLLSEGYSLGWIESDRTDFIYSYPMKGKMGHVSYTLTPDFFKKKFKNETKFRNTIFLAENCHNGEGDFPDTLTNENVGIGLFASWVGTLSGTYTKSTTIPFLENLSKGLNSSESLLGITTSFSRPTDEITRTTTTYFGFISTTDEERVTEPLNFILTKNDSVKRNDIVLFNESDKVYIIGDKSFLLGKDNTLVQENKTFIQGLVNSIRGIAHTSNRIKFYYGHDSALNSTYLNLMLSDIIEHLEVHGFHVEITNEESIQLEGYRAVFILTPGIVTPNYFNSIETNKILSYVKSGGSLTILSENNTLVKNDSTVNTLLDDLGINLADDNTFSTDTVITEANDYLTNHILSPENLIFNQYTTFNKGSSFDGDVILSNNNPMAVRAYIDTSKLVDETIFDLSSRVVDISIIDSNSIQDEYFDLYINNNLIGKVENPPGSTTKYEDIKLNKGENLIELRITNKEISDTRLTIRFDPDGLDKVFQGDDISYTWKVIAP